MRTIPTVRAVRRGGSIGTPGLVGGTTAGAAHLNQGFELPGFQVLIPTGRPVSPVTGGNWEGTGVTPHYEVTAEQALGAATRLATATSAPQ